MGIRKVRSSAPFLTFKFKMSSGTSFPKKCVWKYGTDKFISLLNRISMKLHGKFCSFLQIKTEPT